MDFEIFPTDPGAAQALVALVLADIDEGEHDDRDQLLYSFERTAWPSQRAQNQ